MGGQGVADPGVGAASDGVADAARDEAPDAASDAARQAEADADARVLASTVRLQILRLCLDEDLSNRELSARLGKDPASLLHHVRRLVDRGFLVAQPVRRGTRGSREVPYRATGKSWSTPLLPGQERVVVDAFLADLALVGPDRTLEAARMGLRLDEAGFVELRDRLRELLDEFKSREPTAGGTPYSVFVAVHEDVLRMPVAPEVSAPRA